MAKQWLPTTPWKINPKVLPVIVPCFIGVAALSPSLHAALTQTGGNSAQASNALEFPPLPKPGPNAISSQSTIAATPVTNQPIAANPTKPIAAKPTKPTQAVAANQSSRVSSAPANPQALTVQSYSNNGAEPVPLVPIRVGIVQDAGSISVATSEPGVITDGSGTVLGQIPAQSALGITPRGGGLLVGTLSAGPEIWIRAQSETGLVFVDEHWYRGAVRVIRQGDQLMAINHLDLESYLYSVVGSEMPASWPIEALKAQAVAARSYALVHIVRPADDHFDLGDTPRWQAYSGVSTETQDTLNAVDATRGVLISYEGGVVESLYASTDGLVQEAHSGYGMSQYGAKDLADQNLSYGQILGRFYPGTHLALLQAD
jgi:stage II sporulation protein D